MFYNNDINKPVRIWYVISWENAKKIISKESAAFKQFKLYTLLAGNVVQENPGMMRKDDIVFYDVTRASHEFLNKYAEFIDELHVKDIIKKNDEKKSQVGKLISIVPASITSTLTSSEKNQLGNAFCAFKDGRIIPVIYRSGYLYEYDDLYISVDISQISPELYDKISNNVTELICNEDGLYQSADSLGNKKF